MQFPSNYYQPSFHCPQLNGNSEIDDGSVPFKVPSCHTGYGKLGLFNCQQSYETNDHYTAFLNASSFIVFSMGYPSCLRTIQNDYYSIVEAFVFLVIIFFPHAVLMPFGQ